MFIGFIGKMTNHNLLQELSCCLPKALYGIRKYFQRQKNFTEYVLLLPSVLIYTLYQSVLFMHGVEQHSKTCDFVEFPKHPFQSR